jgi:hypothetical protein
MVLYFADCYSVKTSAVTNVYIKIEKKKKQQPFLFQSRYLMPAQLNEQRPQTTVRNTLNILLKRQQMSDMLCHNDIRSGVV